MTPQRGETPVFGVRKQVGRERAPTLIKELSMKHCILSMVLLSLSLLAACVAQPFPGSDIDGEIEQTESASEALAEAPAPPCAHRTAPSFTSDGSPLHVCAGEGDDPDSDIAPESPSLYTVIFGNGCTRTCTEPWMQTTSGHWSCSGTVGGLVCPKNSPKSGSKG